jgi:hypothetical protein
MRTPDRGLYFHSDRGSQYSSQAAQALERDRSQFALGYQTPRQFEAEHFKKGSNFFEENVTAASSQKRNEVQESKRNKWKRPTRSVGSSPFMPDYDLERSEVF